MYRPKILIEQTCTRWDDTFALQTIVLPPNAMLTKDHNGLAKATIFVLYNSSPAVQVSYNRAYIFASLKESQTPYKSLTLSLFIRHSTSNRLKRRVILVL